MTNAEKYNLNEEQVKNLIENGGNMLNKLTEYINGIDFAKVFELWLKQQAETPITQDEKTILGHICLKRYDKIGRKLEGALYLGCTDRDEIDSTFEDFFEGIFEWINVGEEYNIKELISDDKR